MCDRKTVGSGVNENTKLANELHKPIIRKFNKRKVYSSFKDNIWGVDLADMQLLSKFNKGIKYLLCAIDLFSKYAFVVPLKDKKGISIVNAFQSILNESKRKPYKIWVDKGSEFYNASFKKWLQDNDIVMYSTNNEGKSVVAEKFIRTLKSKIYKYMTSISKNVYIDKLKAIVNKYNNTYHTTIKLKPIDVKDNTYSNTFLDVLIDNCSNILNTTTYHKSTYSGLLLNFESFTSRFYKISLIKCLIDRAYKINNTWASFHNDVTKIKETLKRNSFPPFLIDKIAKSYFNKVHSNSDQSNP